MVGTPDPSRELPSVIQEEIRTARRLSDPRHRAAAESRLLLRNPSYRNQIASWLRSLADGEAFPEPEPVPAMVGPYRVVRRLGEGGFGQVLLAEQFGEVNRFVAVKLLKLGMDSVQVLRRFDQERQSLAIMSHAAIAKLFDAGRSSDGRPYFVMEYIDGLPITSHCDLHRVGLEQRFRLLIDVCHGVHHAHQKGVLHRDLKPGNILVRRVSERDHPSIIDFGIARAISAPIGDSAMQTGHGVVLGTPEYMAPEQASESALLPDIRVDVYALGVVLYELLTGTLPFASDALRRLPPAEVARFLRETTAERPSSRLLADQELAHVVAGQRSTTPAALRRALLGDLDWIALKAMAKEPDERYSSAPALADDLLRYLTHQPVEARPPSASYRWRKLVRRRRVECVAGLLVGVVVAAGGASTYVQFRRAEAKAVEAQEMASLANDNARIARIRASKNAVLAEQASARANELDVVARFQANILGGIDVAAVGAAIRGIVANSDTDPEITDFTTIAGGVLHKHLVQPSLAVMERDFADQPVVLARLLQSHTSVLVGLGLMRQACPVQLRVVALRRQYLGDCHEETIRSVGAAGTLLKALEDFEAAEPYFVEAVARWRDLRGEDDADTLSASANLAVLRHAQGRWDEAEAQHRNVLFRRTRLFGPDSQAVADSLHSLASVLDAAGKTTDAEPLLRRAIEIKARQDRASLGISMNNLAEVLRKLHRSAEAEGLLLEVLSMEERQLGRDHITTVTSLNNLAMTRLAMGDHAGARPVLADCVERLQRRLGGSHPFALTARLNLGGCQLEEGHLAEAESELRGVVTGWERHPDRELELATAQHALASCLWRQGKQDAAAPMFEAVFALRRELLSDEHPDTQLAASSLVTVWQAMGRAAEAERLARETLTARSKRWHPDHPGTLTLRHNLALALRGLGRLDEAAVHFCEVADAWARAHGAVHPEALRARYAQIVILTEVGRLDEAQPLAAALVKQLQEMPSFHREYLDALGALGDVLWARGQKAEAEEIHRRQVDGLRSLLGREHLDFVNAVRILANNLAMCGRQSEAMELLSEVRPVVPTALGGNAELTGLFRLAEGRALAGVAHGRFQDAVASLEDALRLFESYPGGRRHQVDCAKELAAVHAAWHRSDPGGGHDAVAAAWRQKVEAAKSQSQAK